MKNASPDDQHRSLVMHRRRWTAYFALPFAIMVLAGGIQIAVLAYSQLDGKFGIAVAGLLLFGAVCLAVPVGRSSWKALTDKGPALVLDSRGITDHFHLNAFVPWSDVQSASV